MKAFHAALFALLRSLLAGCATAPRPSLVMSDVRQAVMDTERAFAQTMAERDPAGAWRIVFDKGARACECTATAL
jgi:esterase/lipase superfamily enzyme